MNEYNKKIKDCLDHGYNLKRFSLVHKTYTGKDATHDELRNYEIKRRGIQNKNNEDDKQDEDHYDEDENKDEDEDDEMKQMQMDKHNMINAYHEIMMIEKDPIKLEEINKKYLKYLATK